MPESLRDNDGDVRAYVREHEIQTVLDIGAGSGTYARLLGDLVATLDAVEVWKPYIKQFGLDSLYREVYLGDVRDFAWADFQVAETYDLIVFGDLLEHMTAAQGLIVWEWAKKTARHGLISVPIVHWPQGPVHGNPFEIHVQDHLHVADYVDAYGPFDKALVYEQTATFLTRF